MSMPNIPDMDPTITLTKEESLSILLASIAMEELGQANIINAQAEEIQYVLGTLEGAEPLEEAPTMEQLLQMNEGAQQVMRSAIKNQMLLSFKLEDILSIYKLPDENGENNNGNGNNG